MNKKRPTLRIDDIAETRKRLGQRELSEAQLKLVTGGLEGCQGGTSTTCDDCDE